MAVVDNRMTKEEKKILKEIAEKLKDKVLFQDAIDRAREFLKNVKHSSL